MAEASLVLGDRTLLTWSGSFASPSPLVLFDRDELLDGRFVTSSAQALERLEAMGIRIEVVRLVSFIASELASTGDTSCYQNADLALAGLSPDALLLHSVESGAVGYEEHFPHLSVDALAKHANLAVAEVRSILALLYYCACLESSADELVYDVSELAPEDGLDGWGDSLWKARPSTPESSLKSLVVSLVDRLEPSPLTDEIWQTRPDFPVLWPDELVEYPTPGSGEENVAAPPVPDWAPSDGEEPARRLTQAPVVKDVLAVLKAANEPSPDLATIIRRTLSADRSIQPNSHETFWNAAVDFAAEAWAAGEDDIALETLTALVWRDPESGSLAALEIAGTPVPEKLVNAIRGAFSLQRQTGESEDTDWRAAVVELGSRILGDGDARAGLQLMRPAADVDDPSEALKTALRDRLETIYGLQLLDDGDPALAPFLLLANRPEDADDRQDLARLLFDAIVGSVYEPLLDDEAKREGWFDSRIAPGLAYLEADPTPGGGRRRLGPDRQDTSGPGLGMAMVFLLVLALIIVAIGLALRYG